jgi:predicted site-specific integrase-resolvase
MASHRTAAAHAAVFPLRPSSHGSETLPDAPSSTAAGEPSLTRAALYARVSTEKQEREETVASQVDLLSKAAAAAGYDIAPTSVFIDDGVSGSRLDRPALDRLRDLVAEGAFEVLLVTVPDRLARLRRLGMVSRRAARGRRAEGWGDAAAAREKGVWISYPSAKS